MPKFETRDLIALVALAMAGAALWLETSGHPVPEWLKQPLASILTVILGFYFVDSARKAQGGGAPSPSGQSAPATPKAAETTAAPPAAE